MPATARDWRVTAQQEVSRSVQHISRAQNATDSDMADVLRDCWTAYRASGAAVGAWAQSMVNDGCSWAEIGAALDLPDAQVQALLQPLVAQAGQRLQERLGQAATQHSAVDASPPEPDA